MCAASHTALHTATDIIREYKALGRRQGPGAPPRRPPPPARARAPAPELCPAWPGARRFSASGRQKRHSHPSGPRWPPAARARRRPAWEKRGPFLVHHRDYSKFSGAVLNKVLSEAPTWGEKGPSQPGGSRGWQGPPRMWGLPRRQNTRCGPL